MSSNDENPDDIFNILVASDIHLGYNETDAIRGNDSFTTFEEILQYANEFEVDFILLGGDLFHDAKPSPTCLLRCTSLLRKYCFGDKPVAIEILSDQSENFKESISKSVNYEDPNINISYPIFSIHGNHDDPIGRSAVSSLDILAKLGLINYVGKSTSYTDLTVSPVLMKKGITQIALYGLSYMKDQRLARLFNSGDVKFEKIDSDENWFNILTLHQNRVDRGHFNYIPEEVLPEFMDLVVWGHEHDCRINEESWNPVKGFHVIQPGSPVATSLASGEAIPKHCGLLKVYKKGFKMFPIKLQTVRPFIFDVIVLSEEDLSTRVVNEHELVQDFIKNRVEDAILKAENERSGHSEQPSLPLIRLSVFYERETQQFNVIRFGQQFSDRVANPQDIVLLKKEKVKDKTTHKSNVDMEALDNLISEVDGDEISVESLLEQYYKEQPEDKKLCMLSVKCLGEAVKSFTQKGYVGAFSDVIDYQKAEYLKRLLKTGPETLEDIKDQISVYKESHFSDTSDQIDDIKKVLDTVSPKKCVSMELDASSDEDISEVRTDNFSSPEKKTSASRGRGRGRRGKATPEQEPSTSTRGRGRGSRGGRGSRASAKSQTNGDSRSSLNVSFETNQKANSSNNWLTSLSQRVTASRAAKKPNSNLAQSIYIDDSD